MQPSRFTLDSFYLEHVIDRQPLTVSPDMFLMDVISLMSQTISSHLDNPQTLPNFYNRGRTSCALVMEGSQLKGIFTERDTVALAASQQTLDGIRVGNVMTSKVITLPVDKFSDVRTALTLLRQHHIRHLPIVHGQEQLLGLITFTTLGHAVQPSPLLRIWRVGDVMTPKVVYAPPSTSLLQLSQLMRQHSVSCIVITEEQEKEIDNINMEKWGNEKRSFSLSPIGIVTERDIVQFKALGFDFHELQAQVVMSTPLFLMKPEDPLWDAHHNMRKRQLRRLVVADTQGNLRGVITESSLLKTLNSMTFRH